MRIDFEHVSLLVQEYHWLIHVPLSGWLHTGDVTTSTQVYRCLLFTSRVVRCRWPDVTTVRMLTSVDRLLAATVDVGTCRVLTCVTASQDSLNLTITKCASVGSSFSHLFTIG